MKRIFTHILSLMLGCSLLASCATNPYAATNKVYKKQAKAYAKSLNAIPAVPTGGHTYPQGDYWVGNTNFILRKPN